MAESKTWENLFDQEVKMRSLEKSDKYHTFDRWKPKMDLQLGKNLND